jgi:hypothetical protein
MISRTLLVCLVAFLCLNIASANRLDTRIAGNFTAEEKQFPYVAFISYNYDDANGVSTSRLGTGLIYSATSVITTASFFDNFPTGGANVSVVVGAPTINSGKQGFLVAGTVGKYQVAAAGGTPGAPPTNPFIIPTQYVAGQSTYDIAIIRLGAGQTITFDAEVAIGNFPTSSPEPSDVLYAVAYGNQAPGSQTFPPLKFTRMFWNMPAQCEKLLNAASVNRYDRSQHFCLRSKPAAQTATYQGVCRLDVGGPVVRSENIRDATSYYEVVGLISYADDCDAAKRLPAVIIYLAFFQDNFFTPILGSLETVGNGQDAEQNPRAEDKGNFFCGNGIIERGEKCEFTSKADAKAKCCSYNLCNFKKGGKPCKAKVANDPCLTQFICDGQGGCARQPKESANCTTSQ